jgi:hypothetical protein
MRISPSRRTPPVISLSMILGLERAAQSATAKEFYSRQWMLQLNSDPRIEVKVDLLLTLDGPRRPTRH